MGSSSRPENGHLDGPTDALAPTVEHHGAVTEEPEEPATDPARRRKLDEIFGDVLPSTTSDERDPEPPTTDKDWYERNRPPHHE
jgi:hypothetical protein